MIPMPAIHLLFQQFLNLFVDERSSFHIRSLVRPGWPRPKGIRLTDNFIQGHLDGNHWIAVLRAARTRILSLDLDAKGGPPDVDPYKAMLKRYWQIREVLPLPSAVFESSSSRGLHLYFFLHEHVDTEAAAQHLQGLLSWHGLSVKNGSVEIKPSTKSCLRLPCGRESVLLDPETLKPYPQIGDDFAKTITHLVETAPRYQSHDVLLPVPAEPVPLRPRKEGTAEGRRSSSRCASRKTISAGTGNPPRLTQRVQALYDHGILDFGRFHESMRDVAWYWRLRGASEIECEEQLDEFLFELGLDHVSETLRNAPDRAWNEACQTIKSIYSKPLPPAPGVRGVSQEQWSAIYETSANITNGLHRYRHLQFKFDLLIRFNSLGNDELDLPKKTLMHLLGAHGGTYRERIRFAQDHGIVADCGVQVTDGQCRRYRCLLAFNGRDDFQTVDEALASADISFLSPYMQNKVLANAQRKHDASFAKKIGPISKKQISNTYYSNSRRSRNPRNRAQGLSTHPSPEDLLLGEGSLEEFLAMLEKGQSPQQQSPKDLHQEATGNDEVNAQEEDQPHADVEPDTTAQGNAGAQAGSDSQAEGTAHVDTGAKTVPPHQLALHVGPLWQRGKAANAIEQAKQSRIPPALRCSTHHVAHHLANHLAQRTVAHHLVARPCPPRMRLSLQPIPQCNDPPTCTIMQAPYQ